MAKKKLTLAEVVEQAIEENGFASRQSYLNIAKQKGIIRNPNYARSWFLEGDTFNLFYLKRISDDLGLTEKKWQARLGKNPFEPSLDEITLDENPLSKLLDWYIELKTGKSRRQFILEDCPSIKLGSVHFWFENPDSFPLNHFFDIATRLEVPLRYIARVLRYDPFRPDIAEFKVSKYPLAKLLQWYANFKFGISLREYLLNKEGGLLDNSGTATGWVYQIYPMPLHVLEGMAKDLAIPTEDINKVFLQSSNSHLTAGILNQYGVRFSVTKGKIIRLMRYNPFKPPLSKFKKDANPLISLLDWYIEFRTADVRETYLKIKEGLFFNSAQTAANWFVGRNPFPSIVLKKIVDDLQIPYSEVNQFIDYDIANPFQIDLVRIKTDKNPFARLIQLYANVKFGMVLERYISSKVGVFYDSAGTANSWLYQASPIPIPTLKLIADDLDIPIEHLTEVFVQPGNRHLTPGRLNQYMTSFSVSEARIVQSLGYNPFQAPIEEFRKDESPLGRLLEWYIELRNGTDRMKYFKKKKDVFIDSVTKAIRWFNGRPFPPRTLKKIVDDLQIPYSEVNQFIDYDIAKVVDPNEQRGIEDQIVISPELQGLRKIQPYLTEEQSTRIIERLSQHLYQNLPEYDKERTSPNRIRRHLLNLGYIEMSRTSPKDAIGFIAQYPAFFKDEQEAVLAIGRRYLDDELIRTPIQQTRARIKELKAELKGIYQTTK